MQVIWNTEAVQQLDRLLDYVGQEFGQRVMQSLYTRLLSYEPLLAANPGMGRKEPLLEGHPKGFRSLVVHKYCKIIYYVAIPSTSPTFGTPVANPVPRPGT